MTRRRSTPLKQNQRNRDFVQAISDGFSPSTRHRCAHVIAPAQRQQ
jgi:hypothetical protein